MSSITLRPRYRKRWSATEEKKPSVKRPKRKANTTRENTGKSLSRKMQGEIYKMQQLSIGLEKLDTRCLTLACKENIVPAAKLRGHTSYQLLSDQTPPTADQENTSPVLKHNGPTRKPVPFTVAGGQHARPFSMLQHQQHYASSGFPLAVDGPPQSPLPYLAWADSARLWQEMRSKDTCKAAPESELRLRHPCILPNMRTILLDWMMEVCEEYKLHRETFYLALDMYDRFMDTQHSVQKEQLQLLGVTCLFIASKIEEIYPPKVADFAYVTDGACTAVDILEMELIICKALNWRINHHSVTVNSWMNVYMQLSSGYFRPPGLKAKEFEYPAFSPLEFVRVMQVLDICCMDIASRQFCSSVLAASALYLMSERYRTHLGLITGFELADIQLCVNWLQPFSAVINTQGRPAMLKYFKGVSPQDTHNIQVHDMVLQMLEEVTELRQLQERHMGSSLSPFMECSVFLTPPRQERRCLAPLNSTTV